MVSKVYSSLEDVINNADLEIKSKYENVVKTNLARKYEMLSACLEKLQNYDEAKIRECSKIAEKQEINFKSQLDKEKEDLYKCIDTLYAGFPDKTNLQNNDKFTGKLNTCLNAFQQNIQKVFVNIQKYTPK
jgi:hypothetical protein